MKQLTTLCLALGFLGASQALAQSAQDVAPLARASRTFAAADVNRDGKLGATEISRASIPTSALSKWDKDKDGGLSKDEFLVYYRQLMVNAGLEPGSELAKEVARVERLQKAREEEQARKRAREEAREKRLRETEENAGETIAEKYRRAQEALNKRAKNSGVAGEALSDAEKKLSKRARGVGSEGSSSGSSSGATPGAGASVRERLRIAQEALENRGKINSATPDQIEKAATKLEKRAVAAEQKKTRPATSSVAGEEKPAVGSELVRDLNEAKRAVAERAANNGVDRQKVQEAQAALERRARAAARGDESPASDDAQLTLAEKAAKAKADAAKRGAANGASREAVNDAQAGIDKRARAAATKGAQVDTDVSSLPTIERQQLQVALTELEKRAKAAGWSKEQLNREKRQMIKRAKAKHQDSKRDDPAVDPVQGSDQRAKAADEAARKADQAKAGAKGIGAAERKDTTPPAADAKKDDATKRAGEVPKPKGTTGKVRDGKKVDGKGVKPKQAKEQKRKDS